MEQIRIAKKEDLHSIAAFMTDRFWGLEQYVFISDGLSQPKEIIEKVTESELQLYFTKGDIYIYGDDKIKGVLAGIPTKNFSLLNIILSSLKSNKLLKGISKEDLLIIREKVKIQEKMHNRTWYKKYSKNAYYISQLAVSKECKGTGVFRTIISQITDMCEKNNMDIVLETFSKSNIPIYEHFGFELVETHTNDEFSLSEYCMIKRNG